MTSIKILQPDRLKNWDAFVASHPLGSIYHTSFWRAIIEKAFGHKPLYLAAENERCEIVAGMPLFIIKNKMTGNRLVSIPAAQSCDPLVSDEETFARLIQFARERSARNNIKSFEIKTTARFPLDGEAHGQGVGGFSRYVLQLGDDVEKLYARLHKSSIQRRINKAGKNGVELVVGDSLDDVRHFYRLFLILRKHYGLLPQPFKFFEAMWEVMRPEGGIEVLHARYQGEVVSSIILLKHDKAMTYEYGASVFKLRNLGISPFVLWHAIKRAKAAGCTSFDFGRTDDDNTTLATFKMRWTAEQEALRYYYIPDLGGQGRIRENGLAKTVMQYAMQHSPLPVCEMMGRVLYRYFA